VTATLASKDEQILEYLARTTCSPASDQVTHEDSAFAVLAAASCASLVAQAGSGSIGGKVPVLMERPSPRRRSRHQHGHPCCLQGSAVGAWGVHRERVPPGTYDVSVPVSPPERSRRRVSGPFSRRTSPSGRTHQPRRQRVEVEPRAARRRARRAVERPCGRTALPTGPTPRMADGKPDLSGFLAETRPRVKAISTAARRW